LEPLFDKDSYGYRPGKSAHDAIAVTRKRCWQYDWVVDLPVADIPQAGRRLSLVFRHETGLRPSPADFTLGEAWRQWLEVEPGAAQYHIYESRLSVLFVG